MSLTAYGTTLLEACAFATMLEGCTPREPAEDPSGSGWVTAEGLTPEMLEQMGGGAQSEDAGGVEITDYDGGTRGDGSTVASDYSTTPEILDLVNKARATGRMCGDTFMAAVPPVKWSDTLAAAALGHSRDMAGNDYFSHCGRNGSRKPGPDDGKNGNKCPAGLTEPWDRAKAARYPSGFVGENIALGQISVEAVMASWLKSAGHCSNIMNPQYTEIGTAYALGWNSNLGFTPSSTLGKARYWTMNLGKP